MLDPRQGKADTKTEGERVNKPSRCPLFSYLEDGINK